MKNCLLIFVLLSALAFPLNAATKNLVPNSPGDGGLGTASKAWREVNAATGAFSAKLTLGGAPVATTNQAGVIALDVAQRVVETNGASLARTPVTGLTNHDAFGENIVALRSRDHGFQWFDLVNGEPMAEFLNDGFTFHKTIVSEGDAHFAVMPFITGTNLGTFLTDALAKATNAAGIIASARIHSSGGYATNLHLANGPDLFQNDSLVVVSPLENGRLIQLAVGSAGEFLGTDGGSPMWMSIPSNDPQVTPYITAPVVMTNKVMTMTASADVVLTHTTNRSASAALYTSLYIHAGPTNRLIVLNTNWNCWGCTVTNLVRSNAWAVVHLMNLGGTEETNVHVRLDQQ